MEYWKRHSSRLEPDLIRRADGIVANSQYLADYAKQFNSCSYYVGQGCDISHFLQVPDKQEGGELSKIAHPRVGYIGALNSERLDIPLLVELANRMKDFNFVLVGQEDEGFLKSNLHELDNVFFLGRKDFSELPALLYGFDVAINPQRVNEITVGNYPRKVDEYLAAGRPVVATRTLAMKPFEDHVYLATDASDYESLVREALLEDSEFKGQGRRNLAAGHTWGNNVSEIMKAIDLMTHEKQR
jgi:glycosyltransferase involved in cell wall biosynthesis